MNVNFHLTSADDRLKVTTTQLDTGTAIVELSLGPNYINIFATKPEEIEQVMAGCRKALEMLRDGYRKGEKCPCVCGVQPDGGGREVAQDDCEICGGAGRVK